MSVTRANSDKRRRRKRSLRRRDAGAEKAYTIEACINGFERVFKTLAYVSYTHFISVSNEVVSMSVMHRYVYIFNGDATYFKIKLIKQLN